MKTFFKRTAAAATGTVLALTQLAATTVINVNAEETSKWDKAWVVNVPVEDAVASEQIVVDGTVQEVTSSVKVGESTWNNDFQTGILAIAGSGAVDTKASASALQKAVKLALEKSGYADAETAQAIADAVSSQADVKVDDGETVITIDIANCGKDFGVVIENMMRKTGCKLQDDLGNKIEIDWTSFVVKGTVTIDVTYTYDKNISYAVTFTDEDGVSYTADKLLQYAEKKYTQAAAVIQASAAKIAATYGITDFTLEMGEFNDYAQNTIARIKKGAKAAYAVSVSGTELDATYADYLAAENAVFENSRTGLSILKKAPATATEALTNSKLAGGIDTAIGALKNVAGDVQIDITAADLSGIVLSGYNYNINVPNGASADMIFSIADDQADELLAALQAVDDKVESVTSHKEITLNVDNKIDGTGILYYNVVRYIDAIKLKEEETTTTTTSTSSSSSEETTTTTSSSSSSSEETTTTTSSSSSSSEETTTTTSSSSSSSESSTTTTTTVSYSVEYRANGADLGEKVYWSEETTEFNLDGLKIALNIYKDGEIASTIDVSSAFGPTAKSASELNFMGFGHYEVPVQLKNLAAVRDAVVAAGYTVDELGTDTLESHVKVLGAPQVILVLRGDMNLDNKVDVKDAQTALVFYGDLRIGNTIDDIIKHSALSEDFTVLPYEHYAADVFDGNGKITVQDAQSILRFYGDHRIGYDTAWVEYTGTEVVVQTTLHADPLANDEAAASYFASKQETPAEEG